MSETASNPTVADASDRPAVLVVEDSPVNAQLALMQLEALGYAADAASNGREALERMEAKTYAIILMDCQMPEMDGFEATWQIRHREQSGEAEQGKAVQIIAMTADTAEDSRDKCLAAGMNDYIRKPVQIPELEAALDRATREPGAGGVDEVLDPLVLAGLRMLRRAGREDPVAQLASMFRTDAPEKLSTIRAALEANDMWSISKIVAAATSLKGSAANLGARDLAGICGEMEEASRRGNLEEVRDPLERAHVELERVREALKSLG